MTRPHTTTAGDGPDAKVAATSVEGVRYARGDAIGRYLVLDLLGAGGMGAVYRAYDPELDRQVAVKVLRYAHDTATQRTTLLREARALARLCDPHVVTVYDVGTHDDVVFLAMELVDGVPLQRWVGEAPRSWKAIVRVFVRAGRGLAAAHDAGLCHRDFKPANVLVARDGAVRVVDFGLAGMERLATGAPAAERALLGELATHRGPGFAGTVAYAAPEVLAGQRGDAAGDQFSFCVALDEALGGPSRARGGPSRARGSSLASMPVRPDRIPRALRKLIDRGLSMDPQDRHRSMHDLVAGLERLPNRQRRWLAAAAGLATTVGIAIALLWGTADPCEAVVDPADRAWPPARRERLALELSAADVDGSPRIAEAMAVVDAELQALTERRADLCRAEPNSAAALVEACLDERSMRIDSLLHVFASERSDVGRQALPAVFELPRASACDSTEGLREQVEPPPPALAPRIHELRRRLALVAALETAGDYAGGSATAADVEALARDSGYPPIEAEAAWLRGRLLERSGDFDRAAEVLERSYWTATAHRHDRIAARAGTLLVFVHGVQRHDREAARTWEQHAEAAVRRLGESSAEAAELANVRGTVRIVHAEYEAALHELGRSLVDKQRWLSPDHPSIAGLHSNLGVALEELGRLDEAQAHYERSRDLLVRLHGPEHPEVARAIANLAGVAGRRSDHALALRLHRQALTIKEAVLGIDHPSLGYTLDGLGVTLRRLGHYGEAERVHRRELELTQAKLGSDHPAVGTAWHSLAQTLRDQGRWAEAESAHRHALDIWTPILGPEHPHVAIALADLGVVQSERGHHRDAVVNLERSLGIVHRHDAFDETRTAMLTALLGRAYARAGRYAEAERMFETAERGLPATDPEHVSLLEFTAELDAALGRRDVAIARFERALERRLTGIGSAQDLAHTRFALAQLLWAARERPRARELARSALVSLENSRERIPLRARVRRWVAEHG